MNKEYIIETSLTLDYRSFFWGLERMSLDSISNHLPADSNGTKTTVTVKQGGRTVDFREANPKMPAEEIVIEDDGSGYEAGLLSVLFSPKAEDSTSVGQFGEGLKLVATAALREGIGVEYRSKNWRATPFKKPEIMAGKSIDRLCFNVVENGSDISGSQTVFTNVTPEFVEEIMSLPQKVLAFNDDFTVLYEETEDDKDQTIFNKFLTPDPYLAGVIPGYLNSLDELVKSSKKEKDLLGGNPYEIGNEIILDEIPSLDPRDPIRKIKYAPSPRYKSRIIDMGNDSTSVFVKGVRVQSSSSIFSYDLGLDTISPDRKFVDNQRMLDEIKSLLTNCTNDDVIKRVISEARENPERNYDEFLAFAERPMMFGRSFGHLGSMGNDFGVLEEFASILSTSTYLSKMFKNFDREETRWASVFKKMYGEDAVLASENTNVNTDAILMGYNPIKLNMYVARHLQINGVISADDIENKQEYRWVDSADLNDAERSRLETIAELNQVVLEEPRDVDVRVYSGLFLESGREVESSLGVQQTEPNGTRFIGIKREALADPTEFNETYLHELGHYETGAGDADRRFVDFFVKALAKLAAYQMANKNS